MDRLDFAEIEAFLAVVASGSYTKAGRHLGTSKSSVSRRVVQLERRLGVPLLQRSTRSLHLTEEGTAFHTRVAHAMAEVSDAAAHVRDLQGAPRGHLRITAPSDMGQGVGAMIVAFTRAYPEVTVELQLDQRTVDLVREGFDLAIRAGPLQDSGLMAKLIQTGRPRLYASPAYLEVHGTPLRPEDLLNHECLLFKAPSLRSKWPLMGPLGPEPVEVRGRISTNNFSSMLDMLQSGGGIGPLPPQFAGPRVAAGSLICVLPDYGLGESGLHLVYPGGRQLSAKVRVFRDFAEAWLKETLLEPEKGH